MSRFSWIGGAVALISAILVAHASASISTFTVLSGGQSGDLKEGRIYFVNYSCSDPANLKQLAFDLFGHPAFFTELTLASTVSIERTTAPFVAPRAVSTATNATTTDKDKSSGQAQTTTSDDTVFSVNPFVYHRKASSEELTFNKESCSGQFFINGNDSYRINAFLGLTTNNTFAQILAKAATLADTASTSLFAIFSKNTPPPELSGYATKIGTLLDTYQEFRNLFEISPAPKLAAPIPLKVGTNKIIIQDSTGQPVAKITFTVGVVDSLVNDGQTKFLKQYEAQAQQSAEITTVAAPGGAALDPTALREKCDEAALAYVDVGIRNDFDVAYLLYRRLLQGHAKPMQIAQCLGPTRAVAAVGIQKFLQVPVEYQLTKEQVLLWVPPDFQSRQPHGRPGLNLWAARFSTDLARHLLTDGLRGEDLARLTGYFENNVKVVDETAKYWVMDQFAPNKQLAEIDLTPDQLLQALRSAGLVRWGCVQETRMNHIDAVPLYSPTWDSAVMVVAAKVESPGDHALPPTAPLDYTRDRFYGVHLLFNVHPNGNLAVSEMVFEDKYIETILKQNQNCMENIPGPQPPGTATASK